MNILITGGASGLGEAITRKLAEDTKQKVYFTYNQSERNARIIEAAFDNTSAIKCDFRINDEVNTLKESIAQLNISVLVNNAYAGTFTGSYFHKTPAYDFLSEFKENIIPTIEITQACINYFRKQKNGKIITILTSALINTPPIGTSIYTANKAYLEQMTKVWATENARFGITSNAISPAFMLTGFTNDMDERVVEQIKTNHPLNTILTTGEVAASVNFLAGATSQINGINLIINSGSSIK